MVVPVWNNLLYTQQFVDSIRRHTDVPYELIVVDNGSDWVAANYARAAADHVVLNATNLGFARGMNQGLAMARGRYVAFCNNDTVMPSGWAETLVETARLHPDAAVVVPAVTSARNQVNVRTEPGDKIEVLSPFSAPPAAIIYVMPADIVRALGAWSEEYEIASGEDVDLCFKAWVNDLDVVYDQRVLVQHVGKGTSSLLDDWQSLWARNRRRFLDKWTGDGEVPRLDRVDAARFARNRETARSVAGWMDRYFTVRDREDRRNRRMFAKNGPVRRGSWERRTRCGARCGRSCRRGWRTGSARRRGASSNAASVRLRGAHDLGVGAHLRVRTFGESSVRRNCTGRTATTFAPTTVTMRNGVVLNTPSSAGSTRTDPLGACMTMR